MKKICQKSPGQLSLNQKQPALLKAIADIEKFGAAADSRRRCDVLYKLAFSYRGINLTILLSKLYR